MRGQLHHKAGWLGGKGTGELKAVFGAGAEINEET